MRHLHALAMCLAFALALLAPVAAFEVINVPEDVNAVNLSQVVEVRLARWAGSAVYGGGRGRHYSPY